MARRKPSLSPEEAQRAGEKGAKAAAQKLREVDPVYYASLYWGVAYLALRNLPFLAEDVWEVLRAPEVPEGTTRKAIGDIVKAFSSAGLIDQNDHGSRATSTSNNQKRPLWLLTPDQQYAVREFIDRQGSTRPAWLPKKRTPVHA